MFARLLLLFIVVPLIELALLLYLAQYVGWQMTLLIVIATGLAGTTLARSQGFRTYRRIQEEFAAGRTPTNELLDAVLIFCAGALLLTPGVLTDALGLSLLIPPCRSFYRKRLVAWFQSRFQMQSFSGGAAPFQPGKSEIIDSYVVDAPDDPPE